MQCVKICGTVAKLHPSSRFWIFGWVMVLLCYLIATPRIISIRRRSENLHFRCHSLSETRLQNRSESSFYTTIIVKKSKIWWFFTCFFKKHEYNLILIPIKRERPESNQTNTTLISQKRPRFNRLTNKNIFAILQGYIAVQGLLLWT